MTMTCAKKLTAVALITTLFIGCSPSGDDELEYSTPSQPEDTGLDGKADELNKDVRKEEVSESLRSSGLRRLVCGAVLANTQSRAIEADCTGQEFEVTAYYSNLEIEYRGKPMLVAMDVKVSTADNAVFATQLVRDFASPSLKVTWRAEYLSQLEAPDTAELDKYIEDGGPWPESSYSDSFVEASYDDLPAAAKGSTQEQIGYVEEGLQEDYEDDWYSELYHTFKIVNENGDTIGWATSYSLSYGNGDGGVTFYFDVDGNFIDELRYYA